MVAIASVARYAFVVKASRTKAGRLLFSCIEPAIYQSGYIPRIPACHRPPISHVMNTYHIAPEENGFQVIETYPDHRNRFHGGFVTKEAALRWLENPLSLMDVVDQSRWLRERTPQPSPTHGVVGTQGRDTPKAIETLTEKPITSSKISVEGAKADAMIIEKARDARRRAACGSHFE